MTPVQTTDEDWHRAAYGGPSGWEPEHQVQPEPIPLRAVMHTDTATPGRDGHQEKGTSQATALVALAEQDYTFHRDTAGAAFALPDGGHIVRPLRGDADSLRAELAARYYAEHGKAPSSTALADALQVLLGKAASTEPVPVHLRVAETADALWLDLGDLPGRWVQVTAAGWSVVDRAPTLFRRTALTGALPVPVPGGDLGELWDLVNIHADDRPVVLAVLVATLLPGIAHPVTFLLAEQGTGKSTGVRTLAGLLDPSPVPLRKPPRTRTGGSPLPAGPTLWSSTTSRGCPSGSPTRCAAPPRGTATCDGGSTPTTT